MKRVVVLLFAACAACAWTIPTEFPPLGVGAATSSRWTPLELRPIAWYKGDGDATDSAGEYDGTWEGAPAYADGTAGRAFSFVAGTSKLVSATPYTSAINRAVGFSIAAWIQMDGNFQDYGEIMFTRGAGEQYMGLTSPKNSSASARFRDASNTARDCPSIAFTAGQWKHIVLVLDSTAGRCYVNGELSSSTGAHTTPYTLEGTALYIGGYRSISPGNNNRVDDVLIFDRALTAEEVEKLYHESAKRNGEAW